MNKFSFKINNGLIKYCFIFILLLFVVFFSCKYFFKFCPLKNKDYIVSTLESISEVNNSSKTFLDNSSLNIEKALEVLPKMKTDLINISLKINSSDHFSEPEYIDRLSLLTKGLNQNILIIEQIEGMLQNPCGNDIDISASNLKIFRDTADSYYSLLSVNDTSFNLGMPLYSVINATIDYCVSNNDLNKISNLKKEEYNNFIKTMKDLVLSLDNILIDYSEKVLDCRTDKITYEVLISDIDACSNKLQSIKDILSKMSIPDNLSSIYNDFSEIVNVYSDYLYNLKYAVVTEKVRRESKDLKENFMDSLYTSSNETFEKLQKKYKAFTKVYNNLDNNN